MKTDRFFSSDKPSGSGSASQVMAALIVGASIAAFLLVASVGLPRTADAATESAASS